MFEKIKYGSYPQNADFDDLPIEYEQSLLTKRLIYLSTNNIVERLKVILIERYLDNRIYECNIRDVDFDDLRFDGDKMLITK